VNVSWLSSPIQRRTSSRVAIAVSEAELLPEATVAVLASSPDTRREGSPVHKTAANPARAKLRTTAV
jgi:hypothetical protein